MQEVIERKPIKNIDFNCDLAQAYGIYKNIQEYELLDYVSSVNISCGYRLLCLFAIYVFSDDIQAASRSIIRVIIRVGSLFSQLFLLFLVICHAHCVGTLRVGKHTTVRESQHRVNLRLL